jgi:hypothetical protein
MAEKELGKGSSLPVYYMEMVTDNVDARLGKLKKGTIVPLDEAKATRWLMVGVAVQTSETAFREQQSRRSEKVQAQLARNVASQDAHAVWDVSTYRDVLTAPEAGLRMAYERGIPLVNVHMLRDEDGDPIAPDADIEDILDARENMHPDLAAPLASHDRSSVMGGGSPYNPQLQGGPMPLSPAHRALAEKVAQQELAAQRPAAFSYDRVEGPANKTRAAAAARRAERRAGTVSPQAEEEAKKAGVTKPTEKASGEQVAN